MKPWLPALCCSTLMANPVLADTAREAWEEEMEQRLQRLEGRGQEAGDPDDEARGSWFDSVEFGGQIEVEAIRTSPERGDATGDLYLGDLELGVLVRINRWVGAEVVLRYEEEADIDTDAEFESDSDAELEPDTALIVLADPEADWYLKAGRNNLPFGVYATQMISDPLSYELGRTNDVSLEAGYANGDLDLSLFLFRGDHSEKIDDFGAQLDYHQDFGEWAFFGNLGYLSNLAESDTIVEAGWVEDDDKRAAWIVGVELAFGEWTLIGDYLEAVDGFSEASDEAPAVFNLELGYELELFERPAVLAIGYQGSDEAEDDLWELPKRRTLGAIGIELLEQTWIELEYRRDEQYDGDRDDTLTAQLAVEF